MGRQYAHELEELERTYAWSLAVDVGPLSNAVAAAAKLPLVAVGSGGAFTSAVILAFLQREYANQLAVATTPFLLGSQLPHRAQASAWLFSAGGRNKDIRSALRTAVEREPQQICLLCGAPGSPLTREAERQAWVKLIALRIPSRDGFLAVNSSLAFASLLSRTFCPNGDSPPETLADLLRIAFPDGRALENRAAPLWTKKTLVVLHGGSTQAAALDLESRFTEAALGAVQVADYRNFGHGRHHWLAKHGASTAVLALVGPGDEQLSRRTLQALPKQLIKREVAFQGEPRHVVLSSLFASIQLAGFAGRARGIDPGRPGVPAFGSKLYGLASLPTDTVSPDDIRQAAVSRKSGESQLALRAGGRLQEWDAALEKFRHGLSSARIGGLVLDYDGTIRCGLDRSACPTGPAVGLLRKLLAAGLALGIATGRGGSVVEPLRNLFPKRHWKTVLVGYHNGATVCSLAEEPPNSLTPMSPELVMAKRVLEEKLCPVLPVRLRAHPRQLTLLATSPLNEADFWAQVAGTLSRAGLQNLTVLRSSHSVDVLAPAVSKLRVVEAVSERLGGAHILCIGDRGRWPGNDHELLATKHSLSVDEVSEDTETGWNLAPPGLRGADALAYYLQRIKKARGTPCWRILLT